MDDSNKQICRLCLGIAPSCECKTIEEIRKEILEVLPININLEISDYAVVCNRCLESLHNYFDFKSQCINTFMDVDIKVDIKKEVFQSELINDESIRQENSQVCRFCMSHFEVEPLSCTADWKDVLLKNVVRSCLPDLDLNAGHALLVCKRCLSNITRYYEFLKHSQEIEQRIEHFCQVRGHSTTGTVNLKDMLTSENCDVPINSTVIIKKECPDVQCDDTNCLKSEEIVNIKCEEVDIKDELDNNSCDQCTYSSNHKGHLEMHKRVHQKDGTREMYKCQLCDYQAKTSTSLKNHMIKIHKNPCKVPTFKCALCPYEGTLKKYLYQHITRCHYHKDQLTFKCALCLYTTQRKSYLKRHSLIHQELIHPIKCDQCDFYTKHKSSLHKHMKLHDTVKPPIFKCDKCEYSTWRKCNFKQHKVTHMELSEIIAYKCAVCDYQAKYKSNLRDHIKRYCLKKKNDRKTTIG